MSVDLPAPFSPTQRVDLAPEDREVDAAEGLGGPEPLLEPARLYDRGAHGDSTSAAED